MTKFKEGDTIKANRDCAFKGQKSVVIKDQLGIKKAMFKYKDRDYSCILESHWLQIKTKKQMCSGHIHSITDKECRYEKAKLVKKCQEPYFKHTLDLAPQYLCIKPFRHRGKHEAKILW